MSEPQGSRGSAHSWIRSNILGLVAIFIALTGSAIASQAASDPTATTAKKVKRGPRGFPGPQGPQGIPGAAGALTGAAGGDLTGNFPNPQIAPEAVGPDEIGAIPAVRATSFEVTAVPNTGTTTIHFDGESFDTAGMHDNVTNNQNLTAPINGIYLIQATIEWPIQSNTDTGAGFRTITLPGLSQDVQAGSTEADTVSHVSEVISMFQGDESHVVASQTSPNSLIPSGSFSMVWLGPLPPA